MGDPVGYPGPQPAINDASNGPGVTLGLALSSNSVRSTWEFCVSVASGRPLERTLCFQGGSVFGEENRRFTGGVYV